MAGHTGIVTGFGSALEGLADGTGVVVVGAEALLTVADGVAVMVGVAVALGVATVVRVAVGFADVTAAQDDEEETAGGAPSPMTTIRTPGIVLNAAIASSRAEGLSAHTVASRPAKRTLAVSWRASSVTRAWSARVDSIAWADQYVPRPMVAASPVASSVPLARRASDMKVPSASLRDRALTWRRPGHPRQSRGTRAESGRSRSERSRASSPCQCLPNSELICTAAARASIRMSVRFALRGPDMTSTTSLPAE